MSEFKKILQNSKKTYNYVLKMVHRIDDRDFAELCDYLRKYQLVEISPIKKTPIHKNPIDFIELENAEIYIVKFTLGYPVSSFILTQEIKIALACPEKYFIVRSEFEWQEFENKRIVAQRELDDEALEKGLKPTSKLSSDPHNPESELRPSSNNFYGNEFLNTFKAFLAKERSKYDNPNPITTEFNLNCGLFKDLANMKYDKAEDYNKDIPDAPKTITPDDAKKIKIEDEFYDIIMDYGTIKNNTEYGGFYINPTTGKRIFLKKSTKGQD